MKWGCAIAAAFWLCLTAGAVRLAAQAGGAAVVATGALLGSVEGVWAGGATAVLICREEDPSRRRVYAAGAMAGALAAVPVEVACSLSLRSTALLWLWCCIAPVPALLAAGLAGLFAGLAMPTADRQGEEPSVP